MFRRSAVDNNTTNYFTPCACTRGNNYSNIITAMLVYVYMEHCIGLLQSTLDVLNQGYVLAAAHSNHQLVWLVTLHEKGLYVCIDQSTTCVYGHEM